MYSPSSSSSPSRVLLCLIFLNSFITVIEATTNTCWYPDATIAQNFVPCSSTGDGDCCLDGDVCTQYGYCLSEAKGYHYRGACTDSTWGNPSCPDYCLTSTSGNSTYVDVLACDDSSSNGSWCCAYDGNCCSSSSTFDAVFGTIFAEPGSSSTGTSSSAATSTQTTTSTSSTNSATSTPVSSSSKSSSHTATIVGAAVGVPLGLAACAALLLLFRERRKRASMERDTVAMEKLNTRGGGGDVSPATPGSSGGVSPPTPGSAGGSAGGNENWNGNGNGGGLQQETGQDQMKYRWSRPTELPGWSRPTELPQS